MGQKAHPYGLRVGIIKDWRSRWFARKDNFPRMLIEDVKLKKYIKGRLAGAAVSNI